MNTDAYEKMIVPYKERQKKRLLTAAGVMVLGFVLAATGIGAIAGIAAMIYLIMEGIRTYTCKSHERKSLKALQKAGVFDRAMGGAAGASTCQIDGLPYAWNEEFLYLPYGAVYPLKDVAWIYPYAHNMVILLFTITINACQLFLADGTQSLLFHGKAKDQEAFRQLLAGLKQTKPELLLGYSEENKQQYQQIKQNNAK